jgi:hypothetical protein
MNFSCGCGFCRKIGKAEALPAASTSAWASLPRAFRALGDGAHDDAACKGDGIASDGEALAVAVGPCGSDWRPEGGFANACDIVDAVGWFGVGGLGLLGHDRLLDVRAATIRGFV